MPPPDTHEDQHQVDAANASFWDELCGTSLAQEVGVTDASPESLRRFDAAYMDVYPYLDGYLPRPHERAERPERLLEIGLGYGTVSQILAERGFDYNGLDIARGPVQMVRDRLENLGIEGAEERVREGSILEAPHPDSTFDRVVAIGCLHHTGDMRGAIGEVHRILKPGGEATVMVYNRRSFRRFTQALARRLGRGPTDEEARAAYDTDTGGAAAPATEYATRGEAKRDLFADWSEVKARTENFDLARVPVPRRALLAGPGRVAGLDLYVKAVK